MNTKLPSSRTPHPGETDTTPHLTLLQLKQQNELFRGSGGVSEGNRALGFRPAFYDLETGDTHLSRFANGQEAPMHLLDGLPNELVAQRQESGRVTEVKPGVIAGFVLHNQFYTREQAARATQQMQHHAYLLSNPDHHDQLLDIWEQFVVAQSYPPNLVRPVVEASWSRCLELNVDPLRTHAPLSEQERIIQGKTASAELLQAAVPVFKRAAEALFHSDSILLLADREGLVLHMETDAETRASAEKVNLIEGAFWGEREVGTNAIGTAIEAQEAIQLYGAEHFCYGIKHWTCSADVIRDPHDGHVIGAVDLSGLTDTYQQESLEFAVLLARMIETGLTTDYFRVRQSVVDATRTLFNQWKTEGLLAFDHRGRLVRANRHAFRLIRELDPAFTLTPQTTVPALDLDSPGRDGDLPAWLTGQIHYPIKAYKRVIGTLIVLADRH